MVFVQPFTASTSLEKGRTTDVLLRHRQTPRGSRPTSASSCASSAAAFTARWACTCRASSRWSWTTYRRRSCSSPATCPTTRSTRSWRPRSPSPSRTRPVPCPPLSLFRNRFLFRRPLLRPVGLLSVTSYRIHFSTFQQWRVTRAAVVSNAVQLECWNANRFLEDSLSRVCLPFIGKRT